MNNQQLQQFSQAFASRSMKKIQEEFGYSSLFPLIIFIIIVLSLWGIGLFKTFKKSNINPTLALVPFLNIYIISLYIFMKPKTHLFFLRLILYILSLTCFIFGAFNSFLQSENVFEANLWHIFFAFFSGINLVCHFLFSMELSKAFKKDITFAFLNVLFPMISYFYLGVSKDVHHYHLKKL